MPPKPQTPPDPSQNVQWQTYKLKPKNTSKQIISVDVPQDSPDPPPKNNNRPFIQKKERRSFERARKEKPVEEELKPAEKTPEPPKVAPPKPRCVRILRMVYCTVNIGDNVHVTNTNCTRYTVHTFADIHRAYTVYMYLPYINLSPDMAKYIIFS